MKVSYWNVLQLLKKLLKSFNSCSLTKNPFDINRRDFFYEFSKILIIFSILSFKNRCSRSWFFINLFQYFFCWNCFAIFILRSDYIVWRIALTSYNCRINFWCNNLGTGFAFTSLLLIVALPLVLVWALTFVTPTTSSRAIINVLNSKFFIILDLVLISNKSCKYDAKLNSRSLKSI